MVDRALRQSVWDGRIPIRFSLVDREVASLRPPDPVFAAAPRSSYLPVVARDALVAFREHAAPGDREEVWFDVSGVPMKW